MNAFGSLLSWMCAALVAAVVCHAAAAATLWVVRREFDRPASRATVCPHLERWR